MARPGTRTRHTCGPLSSSSQETTSQLPRQLTSAYFAVRSRPLVKELWALLGRQGGQKIVFYGRATHQTGWSGQFANYLCRAYQQEISRQRWQRERALRSHRARWVVPGESVALSAGYCRSQGLEIGPGPNVPATPVNLARVSPAWPWRLACRVKRRPFIARYLLATSEGLPL